MRTPTMRVMSRERSTSTRSKTNLKPSRWWCRAATKKLRPSQCVNWGRRTNWSRDFSRRFSHPASKTTKTCSIWKKCWATKWKKTWRLKSWSWCGRGRPRFRLYWSSTWAKTWPAISSSTSWCLTCTSSLRCCTFYVRPCPIEKATYDSPYMPALSFTSDRSMSS